MHSSILAWSTLALATLLGAPNLGLVDNSILVRDAAPRWTEALSTWLSRSNDVQDLSSECLCEARSPLDIRASKELVVGIFIGLVLGPVLEVLHPLRLRWRRMLARIERQWQARPPAVP